MKFEIRRTRNKQFRVVMIGVNGEPLFTSETYERRAGARKVIRAALRMGTVPIEVWDCTGAKPRAIVP